jgi:hypothetical protein
MLSEMESEVELSSTMMTWLDQLLSTNEEWLPSLKPTPNLLSEETFESPFTLAPQELEKLTVPIVTTYVF